MTIVLRASARRRMLFTPHPFDGESKSFLPRIHRKVKDSTRPKARRVFAGLSLFFVLSFLLSAFPCQLPTLCHFKFIL